MKRIIAFLLTIIILSATLSGCVVKIERMNTGDGVIEEGAYDDWDFQPPLWRVTSGDGGVLYLFGTIHIGDERTEVVISRLEDLLGECDAIALEFDILDYQSDYAAIQKETENMLYRDGSTVKDHVSPEFYERMAARAKEIGYKPELFDSYNLFFWYELFSSSLVSESSSVSSTYAADMLLNQLAYDRKIPVLSVESADEQFDLLLSLSDETFVMLIEELLNMTPALYSISMSTLYNLWLSGSTDLLEMSLSGAGQILDEKTRELIDEYNKKLIDERNVGMAKTAEEYIKSGDTVFFAVGSGHMLGDAGIVNLLKNDGYKVERIYIKK